MVKVIKKVEITEEIERISLIAPDKRDSKQLETVVNEYLTECEKGGYVDDDIKHFIFEEALQYFYGKNVFEYLRQFSQ